MAAPLAAIVGGLVTFWLAVKSDDGLVADDYYKRGLAINKTLLRERFASQLNYRAQVMFSTDGRRLRVQLTGTGVLPAAVQLRLAHPTRAGLDQLIALHAVSAGLFEAQLDSPVTGRRVLVLEDAGRAWRLSAEAPEVAGSVVVLAAGNR